LEIITLKLIDQQDDFVQEESARLEESQLDVQPHEGSQQELQSQQASHRESQRDARSVEEEENRPLKKTTPRGKA
jgi:hypothetical protein